MPIPALPSLSLGFGGGPSQAISDAGPVFNAGWTGPFAVGSGAEARQTNSLPVTNNTTPASAGALGPYNEASIFSGNTFVTLAMFAVALIFFKKMNK